jgi:hypothetical protein
MVQVPANIRADGELQAEPHGQGLHHRYAARASHHHAQSCRQNQVGPLGTNVIQFIVGEGADMKSASEKGYLCEERRNMKGKWDVKRRNSIY